VLPVGGFAQHLLDLIIKYILAPVIVFLLDIELKNLTEITCGVLDRATFKVT
jgi:hypothetical protein